MEPFTIDLGSCQMLGLDLARLPLPTLVYLNQNNEHANPLSFAVVDNDHNPVKPGFLLHGKGVSEMLPELPRAIRSSSRPKLVILVCDSVTNPTGCIVNMT